MSKGISLNIGLNEFDPSHYNHRGILYNCENDAKSMFDIAKKCGFDSKLLITKDATNYNMDCQHFFRQLF